MVFAVNCGGEAPNHDRCVSAALAHDGHPCRHRHLHRLRNIRNDSEQNIPSDRMKNEHPPQITGLADKQHHKMYPSTINSVQTQY